MPLGLMAAYREVASTATLPCPGWSLEGRGRVQTHHYCLQSAAHRLVGLRVCPALTAMDRSCDFARAAPEPRVPAEAAGQSPPVVRERDRPGRRVQVQVATVVQAAAVRPAPNRVVQVPVARAAAVLMDQEMAAARQPGRKSVVAVLLQLRPVPAPVDMAGAVQIAQPDFAPPNCEHPELERPAVVGASLVCALEHLVVSLVLHRKHQLVAQPPASDVFS